LLMAEKNNVGQTFLNNIRILQPWKYSWNISLAAAVFLESTYIELYCATMQSAF
jgi:hypothetical protein